MSEYKIMIVDDEPDILTLLEKALHIEGFFHIAKIESGISAVDACRKIDPDIIILDVMLPDIDGYEVCRRIRRFPTVRSCSSPPKMMKWTRSSAWLWAETIM